MIFIVALVFSMSFYAVNADSDCDEDSYLLVSTSTLVPMSKTDAIFEKATVNREWKFGNFHGFSLSFTNQSNCESFTASMHEHRLNKRQRASKLTHVERDSVVKITDIQTDAAWGLDRLDQPQLPLDGQFNYPTAAGNNIDIYIIDTGIQTQHTEFNGRAQWGATVIEDEPDHDNHGHGTHVAGIAAGRTFGVAKNANLIAVKALGSDGRGSFSDVIEGLQYVADRVQSLGKQNASIVNLSIQGKTSLVFNQAVSEMGSLGIHVTAAAGNDGQDSCEVSPASSTLTSAVISVGAVDRNDQVATFSNWGQCTTVLAPGVRIRSSDADDLNGSKLLSGTSMASPHVAGLMAILLSTNYIDRDPSAVKSFLLNSAIEYGSSYTSDGQYLVEYAGTIYNPFNE